MTLVLMLKNHHTSQIYALCVLSFQQCSFIGELPIGIFRSSKTPDSACLLFPLSFQKAEV